MCGLTGVAYRNKDGVGYRPDVIILTEKEVSDMVAPDIHVNGRKAERYIKECLKPALAENGKLLYDAKEMK